MIKNLKAYTDNDFNKIYTKPFLSMPKLTSTSVEKAYLYNHNKKETNQNLDKTKSREKITTINISMIMKERLQTCCDNYGNFSFVENDLESLHEVKYLIIKNSSLEHLSYESDLKVLYSMSLTTIQFIDIIFIEDSFKAKKFKNIENYKLKNRVFWINSESINYIS